MRVVLDDRLLIEELLLGLNLNHELYTTTYWYYRACRAAVNGAGGHLSGPFVNLNKRHQSAAIRNLLLLDDNIKIANPRSTIPVMAELSERHTRLNLLNLEATATGLVLDATLLLSAQSATGILPSTLELEGIRWQTIEISQQKIT